MEYTPAVIDEMVRYMANENPGLAGEFVAYMVLSELPGPRRFLHNLLVTRQHGGNCTTQKSTW